MNFCPQRETQHKSDRLEDSEEWSIFYYFWDRRLETEGDIVGGETHISFYEG